MAAIFMGDVEVCPKSIKRLPWLRLCTPQAGSTVSVSGWEMKIPHATRLGQKINKVKSIKRCYSLFSPQLFLLVGG